MSPDENLTSAEIIKRFNHFYDCWLDSITVTYAREQLFVCDSARWTGPM